ncbi:MAG TPA: bifunctional (p)ppGpp synthetase/guanosine-3',5'-bis(diphosphate) 3'-pyrophosphohydrolase [Petrimonas sp.]|jgi:GTP pyrophosphokinase|nr:bifunctional (p)ppGpp synthetase/guanosine-3',5'-bis(diphosphate) 3'-pyrophosphohydrolase [Petrimonas sp.]
MVNEMKLIEEERIIEEEFQGLLNDYLNSNHRKKVDIITRAFNMAREAHKGARRRSGEPYIMHPLAVARIVSREMGLGSTSISAALLHDVVEDTDYTVEDIRALFGDKIAQIVDGLTKISSGMFGEDVSAQAENFRKLLLTMSDDIRVILIKIADRLHNMRTLSSMSPAKQYKITGETLYIYAPLAHRLGLFAIKTELEELCFKYEQPDAYVDLMRKIEESAPERNKVYENFAVPVVKSLDKMGIDYEMRARVKSVYSIWNKMQSKGIEFHEVYDLFAVRIIFEVYPGMDEKKQCWDIYSAITDIYKLRPDRIRDWVSHPKANGYQALHLTVMGPDGKWIEIQIRSRRMDDIAEKGFAAHWRYKDSRVEEDNELDKWLKTIQEVLSNPNPNAIDFLDTVKMNLFSAEIFVFTPKGEIKTLPQGATALDFAYTIHTRVGDQCLGAKVNHKLVPLSHKLRSGDQVEILTSQSVQPQPEWINYVGTAKARTKIEASLRRQRRRIGEKGKKMLDELFDNEPIDNAIFNRILHIYKAENKEDLYFLIGNNEVILPETREGFRKMSAPTPEKQDNLFVRYVKQAMSAIKKSPEPKAVNGTGVEEESKANVTPMEPALPKVDRNAVYQLTEVKLRKNFIVPSCCNPLPGDDVFGYITEKEEVEVHKLACQTGMKLKSNFGNRVIEVAWGDYRQYSFMASIVFTGIDRVGILSNILTKLTEGVTVNIQGVNVESKDGIFEGVFSLQVHSAQEVNELCAKIAKVDGVTTVHRSNV